MVLPPKTQCLSMHMMTLCMYNNAFPFVCSIVFCADCAQQTPCIPLQDPLSNAVARAKELEEACNNVQVQLLDAGHCPHDEVPHIVNERLLQFVNKVTSSEEQRPSPHEPGVMAAP